MEQALFAKRLFAAIAAATLAAPASSQMHLPRPQTERDMVSACAGRDGWGDPAPPAHVFGNTWYVGTCGITALLVQTPDGLVLLDGGIPKAEIEKVLGHPIAVVSHSAKPHAPGQLLSHYAPHAELRLNAEAPRDGEAYLGFGPLHAHGRWTLSATGDLVEAAASLFGLLHEIDATGVSRIAVAPVPHHGLGEAINDRLLRAAAPRDAT